MPIISSAFLKPARDRGNGRLAVFEIHTDHNGDIHEHRYSCPVDHDIEQELLNWVPKLESALINNELESVKAAIQEGADPDTIVLKHLSAVQKAKQVVKALMLGSPFKMIKAAQFVEQFSDSQIDNFFTQAQRIRIRTRQDFVLNNQSIFSSDTREEL